MKLLNIFEENKKTNNIIVMNAPSSNEFSAVFGGKPSASYGASYMQKQIGDLLKNRNVIYCDWEVGFDNAFNLILQKNKNAKITEVYGFSKGGLVAWPAVNKPGVRFVGLMDPSIEGNYTKITDIPSGVTVKMQYLKNRKWGEVGLNYAIKILGNRAQGFTGKSHFDFPRLLFGVSNKQVNPTSQSTSSFKKISVDDYNF